MMQHKNIPGCEALDDSALEAAAGGFLEVTPYRDYIAQSVTPQITSAYGFADDSDRAIVGQVDSAIRSTLVPGASIAGPISSLRASYFGGYRSGLHSDAVRNALDTAVNRASDYISTHA